MWMTMATTVRESEKGIGVRRERGITIQYIMR